MTENTEKLKLPWREDRGCVVDSSGDTVAIPQPDQLGRYQDERRAFITLAVNAHRELVDFVKAVQAEFKLAGVVPDEEGNDASEVLLFRANSLLSTLQKSSVKEGR